MHHHESYFRKNLELLPNHYQSTDTSRMTLGFFCLSALDLLGKELPKDKVEWIYAQQIITPSKAGFRGGTYQGAVFGSSHSINDYDEGHLAMTYTALLSLLLLGDDLKRVKKQEIISTLGQLQRKDGSFAPCPSSAESDIRFLFCACAISFILNDWSGVDIEKAIDFISKCQTYEGGFGANPDNEAHGGSTYCAIASLSLMDKLNKVNRRNQLIQWCLFRQEKGFQGRVNKLQDTCYAYWIGGTLQMLDAYQYVNVDELEKYLESNMGFRGGYGKSDPKYPDVMHSYMGLAGLAIAGKLNLPEFFSPLGVSKKVVSNIKRIG